MNPTFTLPACPMCSSLVTLERPYWRSAKNTSAARGHPCYILVGCAHAVPEEQKEKIRDKEDEIALVEENWALESAALLEARIEGWSVVAQERFRREMRSETAALPGVSSPLNLTPEPPAQRNEPTKEESHGS